MRGAARWQKSARWKEKPRLTTAKGNLSSFTNGTWKLLGPVSLRLRLLFMLVEYVCKTLLLSLLNQYRGNSQETNPITHISQIVLKIEVGTGQQLMSWSKKGFLLSQYWKEIGMKQLWICADILTLFILPGTSKAGIKYKGAIEVPNLSDENDMEDLDVSFSTELVYNDSNWLSHVRNSMLIPVLWSLSRSRYRWIKMNRRRRWPAWWGQKEQRKSVKPWEATLDS